MAASFKTSLMWMLWKLIVCNIKILLSERKVIAWIECIQVIQIIWFKTDTYRIDLFAKNILSQTKKQTFSFEKLLFHLIHTMKSKMKMWHSIPSIIYEVGNKSWK